MRCRLLLFPLCVLPLLLDLLLLDPEPSLIEPCRLFLARERDGDRESDLLMLGPFRVLLWLWLSGLERGGGDLDLPRSVDIVETESTLDDRDLCFASRLASASART